MFSFLPLSVDPITQNLELSNCFISNTLLQKIHVTSRIRLINTTLRKVYASAYLFLIVFCCPPLILTVNMFEAPTIIAHNLTIFDATGGRMFNKDF